MVAHRCIAEGLVGGRDFASDVSLIRADAAKMHSLPPAQWDDGQIGEDTAPRAVREYLETLDDAAFGGVTDLRPKFIACSDPASQWTAAVNGPAIFAYSVNYVIDTDNAVIVDVEASRSIRQAEVSAKRTMVDWTKDAFDLQPERLAADTAMGPATCWDGSTIDRSPGISRSSTRRTLPMAPSRMRLSASILRPTNTPAPVATS